MGQVISYSIKGQHSEADLCEAYATLQQLCTPASPEFCAQEVGKLRVVMKHTKQQQDDIQLLVAAFTEELAAYPPDVVRHACHTWKCNNIWFPAWSELKAICDEAMLMRVNLRDVTRRLLEMEPFR
jgi:hypothetical protein